MAVAPGQLLLTASVLLRRPWDSKMAAACAAAAAELSESPEFRLALLEEALPALVRLYCSASSSVANRRPRRIRSGLRRNSPAQDAPCRLASDGSLNSREAVDGKLRNILNEGQLNMGSQLRDSSEALGAIVADAARCLCNLANDSQLSLHHGIVTLPLLSLGSPQFPSLGTVAYDQSTSASAAEVQRCVAVRLAEAAKAGGDRVKTIIDGPALDVLLRLASALATSLMESCDVDSASKSVDEHSCASVKAQGMQFSGGEAPENYTSRADFDCDPRLLLLHDIVLALACAAEAASISSAATAEGKSLPNSANANSASGSGSLPSIGAAFMVGSMALEMLRRGALDSIVHCLALGAFQTNDSEQIHKPHHDKTNSAKATKDDKVYQGRRFLVAFEALRALCCLSRSVVSLSLATLQLEAPQASAPAISTDGMTSPSLIGIAAPQTLEVGDVSVFNHSPSNHKQTMDDLDARTLARSRSSNNVQAANILASASAHRSLHFDVPTNSRAVSRPRLIRRPERSLSEPTLPGGATGQVQQQKLTSPILQPILQEQPAIFSRESSISDKGLDPSEIVSDKEIARMLAPECPDPDDELEEEAENGMNEENCERDPFEREHDGSEKSFATESDTESNEAHQGGVGPAQASPGRCRGWTPAALLKGTPVQSLSRPACLQTVVVAGSWGARPCCGPLRVVFAAPDPKILFPCEMGEIVFALYSLPNREALVAGLRQFQGAGAAAVVLASPVPGAYLARDCADITVPTAALPKEDLVSIAAEISRAEKAGRTPVMCTLSPPHEVWSNAVDSASPLIRSILRRLPHKEADSTSRSKHSALQGLKRNEARNVVSSPEMPTLEPQEEVPALQNRVVEPPNAPFEASSANNGSEKEKEPPLADIGTAAPQAVGVKFDDEPVTSPGSATSPPPISVNVEAGSVGSQTAETPDPATLMRRHARLTLRTLGAADDSTISGRGVRILCMDGGGIRGLVLVELLRKIEADTGRRCRDLFDLICGTSTGGFMALSLAAGLSLDDVEKQYHRISSSVLRGRGWFTTAQQLAYTGAKYDARVLEEVLRDIYGDTRLLDLPARPRAFVVSALSSVSPVVPYLWRNYQCPSRGPSRYPGTCHASVLTALRATSAAPSYFDDISYDGGRHIDGGVVANNPSAVAIHEARQIFHGRPIELMVSLATGAAPAKPAAGGGGGWQGVFAALVDGSCGSGRIAEALSDSLGPEVYRRFAPEGPAFGVEMDATETHRIDALLAATHAYVAARRSAFSSLAQALRPRGHHQHHRR
mmetsp:Transcript_1270/g.3405  ORF Transcript_1270/g.3405 Transcript_1270/m.3405 type:complete len:1282 (+) Transcript_1270:1961-5806(+)